VVRQILPPENGSAGAGLGNYFCRKTSSTSVFPQMNLVVRGI
jgi:hypothetical protein